MVPVIRKKEPESNTEASHAALKLRGMLMLLAVVAGVAIANIYYNQPLLNALARDFPDSAAWLLASCWRERSLG